MSGRRLLDVEDSSVMEIFAYSAGGGILLWSLTFKSHSWERDRDLGLKKRLKLAV